MLEIAQKDNKPFGMEFERITECFEQYTLELTILSVTQLALNLDFFFLGLFDLIKNLSHIRKKETKLTHSKIEFLKKAKNGRIRKMASSNNIIQTKWLWLDDESKKNKNVPSTKWNWKQKIV